MKKFKVAISPDESTVDRFDRLLSRHFRRRAGLGTKTSAESWMNLQMTYDLRNAERALPTRVRKNIENNRSALA